MRYKVKELLEQSMFTGVARVNRPGSVSDNVAAQIQHLKSYGHKIISSEPSKTKGEHVIVSSKEDKEYRHTLKPHGDEKWTIISTTVKKA